MGKPSGDIDVKLRSSRFADVLAAARANESKIIAGHTPQKKFQKSRTSQVLGGRDEGPHTARLGLGAVPKKETHAEVLQKKLGKKIKTSMKRKRGVVEDDIDGEDSNLETDPEESISEFKARHKPKINPLDTILEEKAKRKASIARKRHKKDVKPAPTTENPAEIDDSAFASNWTDDGSKEAESSGIDVFGTGLTVNTPKLSHLNKSRVKGPRGRHLPSGMSTPTPKSRHTQKLDDADTSSSTTDALTGKTVLGTSRESSDAPRTFIPLAGVPDKSSDTDASHTTGKKKNSKWRIRSKRPKVRSKQKNIKKDNRPEHLKPTYLTPGDKEYKEKKPVYRKGSVKRGAVQAKTRES
eukprot:m.1225756 g.1225756  ORF g.1225756 m.1225756 type:complete len:354 (-) comp24634_c0_seq7:2911-3972(-)